MNAFAEITETELAQIDGGYPSAHTSFWEDFGWVLGVTAGAIYDGVTAYSMGASEGGWSYAKLGYR